MQIPVFIEAVPGNGYRARGGEPFALVGEGATPEEALAQLKDCLSDKLQAGAEVRSIEVGSDEHPWLSFAGMYEESDPLVQEWLAAIPLEEDADEAS